LLVPACTAVELIRRGALQTLSGVPGRPHDPDGAYTFPYLTAISALVYRGAPPSSLDDLWARDALWPDSPRLVIGAALLRRGYPLNDTHPGHLAQAEEDLLRLRPRLAPDPLAALHSGLASLALTLIRIEAISSAPSRASTSPFRGSAQEATETGAMIPPEGAAIVEYDWVIPLGARSAEAALAFIANAPSGIGDIARPPCGAPDAFDASASKLTPLAPLPAAAVAQRASIWKRLKETAP
jgi:spermidine/putrescine-binding protein